MADFKEKAELFNSNFVTQCSLISNSSKLLSHIQYLTDNRLSSVSSSQEKIAKVIENVDSNKAHSRDDISIRMVKVCGPSIDKLLEVIFNQFIETVFFPSEWKNGNIVLIHKKGEKQTLPNYRSMSLVPICGKILERLILCGESRERKGPLETFFAFLLPSLISDGFVFFN